MSNKKYVTNLCKPVVLTGFVAFAVLLLAAPRVFALARSYISSDATIKTGMVVSTIGAEGTSGAQVQKSNESNAQTVVGVVTDAGGNDIAFENGEQNELLVANSGQVQAYVSDINGIPKAGDLMVPSPLDGILMRAEDGSSGVIGAIVGDFPSNGATEYELKDGTKARISIVAVNLDVRPVNKPGFANDLIKLVAAFVGKEVSMVQIIIAVVILIITLVVVGGMMYGAIANYLMSVGRNPLAKRILRRSFLQVTGLTGFVLSAGAALSWAVLWL